MYIASWEGREVSKLAAIAIIIAHELSCACDTVQLIGILCETGMENGENIKVDQIIIHKCK